MHALQALQNAIKKAIEDYMEHNNIGFNEMVRRLNSSPAQLSKMQKEKPTLLLQVLHTLLHCLVKNLSLFFKTIRDNSTFFK